MQQLTRPSLSEALAWSTLIGVLATFLILWWLWMFARNRRWWQEAIIAVCALTVCWLLVVAGAMLIYHAAWEDYRRSLR